MKLLDESMIRMFIGTAGIAIAARESFCTDPYKIISLCEEILEHRKLARESRWKKLLRLVRE